MKRVATFVSKENDSMEEAELEGTARTGRRVAVLGLYNSGSTVLAGMMHRLGLNMGAPFFASSDDDADNNYYEPRDLSARLRRWWREPEMVAAEPRAARVAYLSQWAERTESLRAGSACAKHPLLSLSAPDLVSAWGSDTAFVWAYRPLEESVRGLVRRGWFRGHEGDAQRALWDALHAFESDHGHVTRIAFADVHAERQATVDALLHVARAHATPEQRAAAIAFVRPPT
jgi:hypothetical protein